MSPASQEQENIEIDLKDRSQNDQRHRLSRNSSSHGSRPRCSRASGRTRHVPNLTIEGKYCTGFGMRGRRQRRQSRWTLLRDTLKRHGDGKAVEEHTPSHLSLLLQLCYDSRDAFTGGCAAKKMTLRMAQMVVYSLIALINRITRYLCHRGFFQIARPHSLGPTLTRCLSFFPLGALLSCHLVLPLLGTQPLASHYLSYHGPPSNVRVHLCTYCAGRL